METRLQPQDSCLEATCGRAGPVRGVRSPGFTLLELLVAMAVAGLLTVIAIASYTSYIQRARLSEAFEGLTNYRLKMEQAFQDNGNFGTAACLVAVPADTPHFKFSCEIGNGGLSFVATAKGANKMEGRQFTVNDDGAQATTEFPGASGLPAACWLTRAGGC